MTINTAESDTQTTKTGAKWFIATLWLICLPALITTVVLTYQHIKFKNEIYESAKSDLQQLTVDGVTQIDSILSQAMNSAEMLADGITKGQVNKQNMLKKLQDMLASNANYFGVTITFAPFGFDPSIRLYSAYYSKSGPEGELEFLQLADIYDYTTPEYDWYVEPMDKGNRWGEPYWDEAGKTYLTTYSALFYIEHPETKERVPNGVVTIDISMRQIKNIIESLDVGPSGFGALTTQEGNYLYHPDYDYVLSHKNLTDVAREKNDKDRIEVANRALKREGGIIDHISTTTGQASWFIFEPVPISGWSLQNTFLLDDIQVDVDTLRRQVIWIVIVAIIFLTSLSALILKIQRGNTARIWVMSGITSLLLFVGIGIIWNLALTYHDSDKGAGIRVSDKGTLKQIMNNFDQRSLRKHLKPPTYIPTGVFIEAIELRGANDVSVTGRMWQKYPNDFTADIGQGFQIGRAKNVKVMEIDSQEFNGETVINWRFQADLRTQLDYSRYPLEVEKIRMQILPWETSENIVLVPDLDAYKLMAATLLPGLDKSVFIPGWDLTETFFLFRTVKEYTNFGVERNFDREQFPGLYFEIGIKRIFVDAFISNLTPLIVVTIILFSVSLLPPSIDISRVLGICVSVFFVVVFAHLAIRRNISIGEIFYLEYFFFVIYLTILLAPVNSFRTSLEIPSRFFEYQNGLIPKAIYWPSIMGIFFVITAWKFY